MVTVAVELAAQLVRSGEEVVAFVAERIPAGLPEPAQVVPTGHRHELVNKLWRLPRLEVAAGLDVILYPYWPSPPRRRVGAPPAVSFVHDLAFRACPGAVPWQQRFYLGLALPAAVAHDAALLTPSRATRDDLLRFYGGHGLEARIHVTGEGPASLGEPGQLPPDISPGFLLAVGTVEPRKNYPGLLEAYRRLRQAGPAPPLVVVGRAGWAYGDALERLQREPGVRYLGHVPDPVLAALYRAAACLVMPSLYEGFGLPLLEAMRVGLPAVVSDRGALPELGGEAVLTVDPHDPAAIAAAITNVLDSTELSHRLSAAGRARAASLTWAAAGDRVRQVLQSVMEGTVGGTLR